MDVQVQFVKKSSNRKIGPMPCTNSERSTCPDICPLKDDGCYGEDFYTRMNWDKVDSGERGGSWDDLLLEVSGLPDETVWRHNVVGDLPHQDQVIDADKAVQLAAANQRANARGFTYTHHDMSIGQNMDTVKFMNRMGFAVNLSANNPYHADELVALDIGPVVTVLGPDQMENTETPFGRKIVVCPAVTKANVTCQSCQLCARIDRQVIVGFPAHGSKKKSVTTSCKL